MAVNVAEEPAHTLALFTLIVGKGFTVTTKVAVFIQPAALVPVTV